MVKYYDENNILFNSEPPIGIDKNTLQEKPVLSGHRNRKIMAQYRWSLTCDGWA
jgi:hypothetical protein